MPYIPNHSFTVPHPELNALLNLTYHSADGPINITKALAWDEAVEEVLALLGVDRKGHAVGWQVLDQQVARTLPETVMWIRLDGKTFLAMYRQPMTYSVHGLFYIIPTSQEVTPYLRSHLSCQVTHVMPLGEPRAPT